MANYNKSFNFTNGIQVDTDKFVVNPAGLVGVGTTTPASYLDVYGGSNIRGRLTVTGVTSSKHNYITGVSTFSDVDIGSGIRIEASSGIITASKFYGDGGTLSNVFAVSTSGWFFEAGSPGVAYTTSKVGIGTTNSETFLQIGGLGVDSNSEIRFGKRVSATETTLPAIAQVTSDGTENSLGLAARSPAGKILFYTGSGSWGGGSNAERLRITNTGLVGIGSTVPTDILDVKGTTKTTNLNVTGVATITGTLTGIASVGVGATFGSDLYASSISAASSITAARFYGPITGDVTGAVSGNVTGEVNSAKFDTNSTGILVSGIATFSSSIDADANLDVDGDTELDALNVSGLATFAQNIQLVKSSDAVIAVGKSASITGYSAHLRYGFSGGSFKYSDGESLDLVNYSPGSFNFISNPDLVAGNKDFQWIRGSSAVPLMTLTGIGGSLGIGVTIPAARLHVAGISTFDGAVYTTGNVTVGGAATIYSNGNMDLGSSGFLSGSIKSDIFSPDGDRILYRGVGVGTGAMWSGNVNVTPFSGISTFSRIRAFRLGINTDPGLGIPSLVKIDTLAFDDAPPIAYVPYGSNYLGIGTDVNYNGSQSTRAIVTVYVEDSAAIEDRVGIGTTVPLAALDVGLGGTTGNRFMIPPKVDNAGRAALTEKVAGALIYNTQTNKLNVYNGSAWREVTDSAI